MALIAMQMQQRPKQLAFQMAEQWMRPTSSLLLLLAVLFEPVAHVGHFGDCVLWHSCFSQILQ